MRIAATVAMVVMAVIKAQAGEIVPVRERTVAVCMEEGGVASFAVIPLAQAIASEMFAGIGVTLEWRLQGHGCPAQAIQIRLTNQTPKNLLPGALAYAQPYDRTHIRVFYDRISEKRSATAGHQRLLAHVLVHEITHVLQGVSRHSDQGVMKACWNERDFMRMATRPLPFADEDINLIHLGLEARSARAMVAMNKARAAAAQ